MAQDRTTQTPLRSAGLQSIKAAGALQAELEVR